ncbi:hypothetical protein Tco_0019781 [Tanacetum coccineum]
MTPENKEHFLSEKEAIFLLLTGIGDDIYSTVDACKTANKMWIAIERLQQGESLNVQDVKTNLFWEFGKFTSRDGESMDSYYSRFYKLMNELTRNNLLAKSANPLALVVTAQPYSDHYYQAPKSQRSNAQASKQSFSTRPSASTRHKGKEIAKPVTPQSESVSKEDSDPEQAQRDKDMQKNLARLAKFWPNAKECRKPKRVKGLLYPQGKDDDVANNFMAKDSGGSYIEGISSNEKPIGTDLEVAFRKSTCFVRDLQETICLTANKFFSNLSDGCETAVLNGPLKRRFMLVSKMDPFSDADHADALLLAKATSGGYSSLGDKLVSWMSKNKNCNALYSTRTSNSVIASYAQYVVENGIIELYFVRTEYQLADMFTKALPEDRFKYLVRRIGMRCLTPADLEV